jgi:OH-DDVA oxygenase
LAQIIIGIGTSHTPMLTLGSAEWVHRAADDLKNQKLNQSDGTWISYDALLAKVGPAYADQVTPEAFHALSIACQASLDRLADELAAAAPDVVLIVGDDQSELFGPQNMPVIALYHGADVVTFDRWGDEGAPTWVRTMGRGYAMDAVHHFAGAPDFATALIAQLMERDIDIATSARIDDPHRAGFGHAFGFVIRRLMARRTIPVVPLLLNTYYPPNVPTARRCHDIGRALRAAIEAIPDDLRIAVVASGGLSHFIVDEALDRRIIAGFDPDRADLLRDLPRGALMSGSSEILNWVLTAGAVGHLPLKWVDYYPAVRTPAGTGVGTCFAVWGGDTYVSA